MHKTTHDRHLTGVHWPIHRSRCRGSGTKGDLSTSTSCKYRGSGRRTEAVVYITAKMHIIIGFYLICMCKALYTQIYTYYTYYIVYTQYANCYTYINCIQ